MVILASGDRIRELREQKNLTQEKLSQMMGVTKAAVSLVECNRQNFSFANFMKLCNILNVDACELLNQDNMTVIKRRKRRSSSVGGEPVHA